MSRRYTVPKAPAIILDTEPFEFPACQIDIIKPRECRSEGTLQCRSALDCFVTKLAQQISRSPQWRWGCKQFINACFPSRSGIIECPQNLRMKSVYCPTLLFIAVYD